MPLEAPREARRAAAVAVRSMVRRFGGGMKCVLYLIPFSTTLVSTLSKEKHIMLQCAHFAVAGQDTAETAEREAAKKQRIEQAPEKLFCILFLFVSRRMR